MKKSQNVFSVLGLVCGKTTGADEICPTALLHNIYVYGKTVARQTFMNGPNRQFAMKAKSCHRRTYYRTLTGFAAFRWLK